MDANKYVAAQHFAISMVQPNTFGFTQPWFKGYIGQFGAETAGSCYLSITCRGSGSTRT